MELELRVGGGLLTLLEVVPGNPGEARRVEEALRRRSPSVIAVDAALGEAVDERGGWFSSLVRASLADHGLTDEGEPVAVARRYARGHGIEVVPLLGAPERPGWLATFRAKRAVTGGRIPGTDPRALALGVRRAASEADRKITRILHAGEEVMGRRLGQLLREEQRTRLVALVTYPRSERVAGFLLGKPVAQEVARAGHGAE